MFFKVTQNYKYTNWFLRKFFFLTLSYLFLFHVHCIKKNTLIQVPFSIKRSKKIGFSSSRRTTPYSLPIRALEKKTIVCCCVPQTHNAQPDSIVHLKRALR